MNLLVILVQLSCPGDQREKGTQFPLTCNLCRESQKIQVWLCVLVLSFLTLSTCSASEPVEDLQICVQNVKHNIEKSDATLYAPSLNDIKNCEMMMLKCYMLELLMVMDEEDVDDDCIYAYNEKLKSEEFKSDGCLPCEAYSLTNITVFLERLNQLLEERNSFYKSDQK
ncbi:hypothetical protein PAMP_021211 [Pampus punctatissimus]